MGWQLAPQVHFCVASGRVLFLDIVRDRYCALPLDQGATFLAWQAAGSAAPAPRVVEQLCHAGLLAEGGSPASIRLPVIRAAEQELQSDRQIPWSARDMVDVLRSMVRVGLALRWRGLERSLAWQRLAPAEQDPAELRFQSAVFRRCRRLLPVKPSCLFDTLGLLDFLRRRGLHASIVFGVTATPFRAHCWAQSGTEVLNDALDHITPFTPIHQQ